MKKIDYVCPEVASIEICSDDEIKTANGDIIDVSQGTVEKPENWVD